MNFTKKELTLILETLLFASSCDVGADWYKNETSEFLNLAKKIKENNPLLKVKNIFIHTPYLAEQIQEIDTTTPEILSLFPEILKESI